MKKNLLIIIFICLICSASFGEFVRNMPYKLIQPNGDTINCFVTGDEYYRRYFDENGFTITKNIETGYFVYANIVNDEIIPTNFIVGEVNPETMGILANQDVSAGKKIYIKKHHWDAFPRETDILSKATTIRNGNLNNIAIYIKFTDGSFSHTKTQIESLHNDTTRGSSLFSYFRDISNNQFNIPSSFYPKTTGATVLAYEDSHARAYYQPYDASTNTIGYQTENDGYSRLHTLFRNAINSLASEIEDDFTANDLDNSTVGTNGRVDNISFIIQGGSGDWGDILWPHRYYISGTSTYLNNKRCYNYFLIMENHLFNVPNGHQSVLVHEMYHVLDAPDLYSYVNSELSIVDQWDVMCLNAVPPQHSTAHITDVYGKFIPDVPQITTCGEYTVYPLWDRTTNHNIAYKIQSPSSSNDWYYIEYRKKTNEVYESSSWITGEGIIIYRVNTSIEGNSDYEDDSDIAEVYVFRPNGTTTNETGGQINNAYFSSQSNRTSFSNSTNPACFNSNGTLENIEIYDISASGGDSMTFKVRLPIAPNADFAANFTTIPSGTVVNFTNLSTCADSYSWNFGDGGSSTLDNPSHQYNSVGQFTVTLTATNSAGNDVETKVNYITVVATNEPPIADFSYDTTNSCSGYINFTNLSTNYTSLQWDFGDGNYSVATNPTHQYQNAGNYFVSLFATNQNGTDTYTLITPINISMPTAPIVTNIISCVAGNLTLNATASNIINWYDAAQNGNLIHTGDNYSDNFTQTTTYYVENLINTTSNYSVGASSKTIGNGSFFTGTNSHYLTFDAQQEFVINSVLVYSSQNASRTIQLLDAQDNVLDTKTVNITNNQNGVRVNLNFLVPVGSNYKLALAQGTSRLYRNSNGGNYPYTINNVMSITGNSANDNYYYYYFYDWDISVSSSCVSTRVPITATILDTEVITASNDTSFCEGESSIISVSSSSNWDIYFQGTTQNGTSLANLSNEETISQAGSYYFRAYSPDGNCWGQEALINIEVNQLPATPSLQQTQIEACDGTIVDFEQIQNAHWFFNGNEVFNANIAGIYYAITKDPITGCKSSDSVSFELSYIALPSIPNISDFSICLGNSKELLLVSNALWYYNDNEVTEATAGGEYVLIVTDTNTTCQNSDTIEITTIDIPILNCPNDTVINQNEILFLTASPANGTFSGIGINNNSFDPSNVAEGEYEINYFYTDENTNCSNVCTFTITVDNSVGINNLTTKESYISVFPNPNNGEFTIKLHNIGKECYYKIIDSKGAVVFENYLKEETTKISKNLASGIYKILVLSNNKIITETIIVH